ncbi:copper resistance protein CopC [Bdellovibrio sp. NC01]|uniref:copper resistance CopC family protein n=1 Tax=Bdellovibrio sp. NC01 TaxID=2220073 RepID=UPI00115A3190|nr:copper resistance protein CopC [Bdellovibrio sp. NC01]QDK38591.1 hypothetical protein DOE51_13885 [Bdellovibrio sp. NC01]
MKNGLLTVLLMFFTSHAFAHAHLQKSEPLKDAQVSKLPDKVVLTFSEDVELAMSKIEVRRQSDHTTLSTGPITHSNEQKNTMEVRITPDANGGSAKYEVQWKAVGTDSHPMKGSYIFTVVTEKK